MKAGSVPFHWMFGLGIAALLALLLLVAPRLAPPGLVGDAARGEAGRTAFAGAPLPCLMEEAEPNDGVRAATAQPALCAGSAIPATLPEGDSDDLFWIEVEQAGTVTIALSEIMPERDFDLYLYDSSQRPLASSAQHGFLPEKIVAPLDAGRYLIRVFPFAGRSDERYIVRWQLDVSPSAPSATIVPPTLAPPDETEREGARRPKEEKEDKEERGERGDRGKKDKEDKEDKEDEEDDD